MSRKTLEDVQKNQWRVIKMDWKEFLLQPAIVFVSGTPEEINDLRKNKTFEKKGFTKLIELK